MSATSEADAVIRDFVINHLVSGGQDRTEATIVADAVVLAGCRAMDGLMDIAKQAENPNQRVLILGLGPAIIKLYAEGFGDSANRVIKEMTNG